MKNRTKLLSALFAVLMLMSTFQITAIAYAAESKPTSFKASSYCSLTSHPVISWTNKQKVSGYKVYRATKKNGEYTRVCVTQNHSFTDTSAKVHKTYYYKVRSYIKRGSKCYYSPDTDVMKQKVKKTVLVGDSVMQAVWEYKTLPKSCFVTKIGVGPYSFYNFAYSEFKINGRASTGVNKVISTKADRVFIMLGMNEIDWNSTKQAITNYKKVLKKLKKEMPKTEIVVLAVSPTAQRRSKGNPSMKKVNAYNKAQKKLCKELKLTYYDYTDALKSDGYLKKKYNGGDGCHWNKSGTVAFKNQITKYAKKHK